MPDASLRIMGFVKKIPRGSVASYASVAKAASTSPRAVGAVMRANRDPSVPCHRVVRSNGLLGGFNRGINNKSELLKSEGVVVENGRIDKKYFIA